MAESKKLEKALRKAFNMVVEDARATAKTVESAFRGEEEVNDEDLDKDIRSLFYTLEKEKLLNVRRTEYKFEGQTRRAYFWRVNKIEEWPFDADGGSRSMEDAETAKVYRALPSTMWARRTV